jgi:hypothetical protein
MHPLEESNFEQATYINMPLLNNFPVLLQIVFEVYYLSKIHFDGKLKALSTNV